MFTLVNIVQTYPINSFSLELKDLNLYNIKHQYAIVCLADHQDIEQSSVYLQLKKVKDYYFELGLRIEIEK